MGAIGKRRIKDGRTKKQKERKTERKDLTLTGLLMEGVTENYLNFRKAVALPLVWAAIC
jgi:hypothetical protein